MSELVSESIDEDDGLRVIDPYTIEWYYIIFICELVGVWCMAA